MYIDQSALATILEEAPRFATEERETGGYLMGYRYDRRTGRILHAMKPGPNAVRRWEFFRPDHDHYLAERDRLYALDEYLEPVGMWHTHPTGYPQASPADDECAWWVIENWTHTPDWLELIAVVDDAGRVTRIRVYRYGPEMTKEELPEVELTGVS